MKRWTIRNRWIDGDPRWVVHDTHGHRRAIFDRDEHPAAIAYADRHARQGIVPVGFRPNPAPKERT